MEKVWLGYSRKNIPIPTRREYEMLFMEKVDSLISRMRWKAWHALNPGRVAVLETFGFRTTKAPPSVPQLKEFEYDLCEVLKNIKYDDRRNEFQRKMTSDISDLSEEGKIVVCADKTTNLYKVPVEEYVRDLHNEISSSYKKVKDELVSVANCKAAEIVERRGISDRVDAFMESEAFITIKDHKEEFPTRVKHRLVNPAKSNVGIISQKILTEINNKVRVATKLHQWTNTAGAIEWFKNIENKGEKRFFKYDIVEFYPSISEKLFLEAIEFAKQYVEIPTDDVELLQHCRTAFLKHNGCMWAKKGARNFDVTIGAYDGAEVAEMVGLLLLYKVQDIFPGAGLYRDDGLAATSMSGPQVARAEKKLRKMFNEHGLKITTIVGQTETDFLDVVFSLKDDSFKPFRKPNSEILYINTKSSHPPAVTKALPSMIQRRLSSIASSRELFVRGKAEYEEAMSKAGYEAASLEYEPSSQNSKRCRGRKITWFNPPWADNVRTNITRAFNNLVNKHFLRGTLMGRLFNKNNLKLSYCTTRNMQSVISTHNRRELNKYNQVAVPKTRKCNCRAGPAACPVGGTCLEEGVVYEAVVSAEGRVTMSYIGSSSTAIKTRINNHHCDFRNRGREHATTLSTYVWKLKDEGIEPVVKYRIKGKAKPYSPTSKKCGLCTLEKLFIAKADMTNTLNRRTEIGNKCRHRNGFTLSACLGKRIPPDREPPAT